MVFMETGFDSLRFTLFYMRIYFIRTLWEYVLEFHKISMSLGGFVFTDRGDFRDYNQVRSVVHA